MDKGCALNRVPSFAAPMERMLSEREDDPLFLLSNRIPEGLLTLEEVVDVANTRSGYENTLQTFVVPAAKTANESVAVVILSPVDANDSKEKGLLPPPPPPQEPHAFHQFRTSPSTNSGAGRPGRSPRETNPHLPCYEHPFSAHITSACWLTSPSLSQETISEGFHGDVSNWGKTKRVVGCTVSIDRSGITYNPGDSIGICCPNLPYAVDIVFRRLQLSHPEISLRSCVRLESADNDRSKEEIMTVDELLSFKFDLMGMPKKTTISHLSFCCQNELERKKMSLLSGKDKLSRLLWTHFVENQGLGVAEILGFFPSCRPTLQQLVNMLTPMPPRYYSIASSPMNSPGSVSFAFSLVRNLMSVQGGTTSSSILSPASSEKAGESALATPKMIRRVGVCTSFLEYLLAPYLYPSHPIYGFRKQESLQIRIFHKPTLTFHLPGSVSHPLILIGPGTGVAPFISFLEHRMEIAKERQKNKGGELISSGVWRGGFELEGDVCEGNQVNTFICSVKPGPIYLFYGCRDQHDYLFQDKLQHFSKHKILTDFSVAFSRLPGKGKEYVTHKLVEKKKEIAQLIVEEQASVYICGDGNQMAKDVQTVLREMLTELYPEKVGDINQYMTDLRTRRRLLLDIWS
jgi:sulfite reductase alpha subunit-like flavoprotein